MKPALMALAALAAYISIISIFFDDFFGTDDVVRRPPFTCEVSLVNCRGTTGRLQSMRYDAGVAPQTQDEGVVDLLSDSGIQPGL